MRRSGLTAEKLGGSTRRSMLWRRPDLKLSPAKVRHNKDSSGPATSAADSLMRDEEEQSIALNTKRVQGLTPAELFPLRLLLPASAITRSPPASKLITSMSNELNVDGIGRQLGPSRAHHHLHLCEPSTAQKNFPSNVQCLAFRWYCILPNGFVIKHTVGNF
jgi:hypothetical protein